MKERVLLGFSGGIDSVASALALKEAGYEVQLETLDTTGNEQLLRTAQQSAERIGLPLHITDIREQFSKEIINYFVDSYLSGETPAPCTQCNVKIKWKALYERAVRNGFDHIATGHYFRIHIEDSIYYVRTAVDPQKDQSYYLWGLPQEYLKMALTPMGERIKKEVKESHGNLVEQRESMGVCFLNGVNYTVFLQKQSDTIQPGTIIDSENRTVGRHEGCALYTIGQKRGLKCCIPGAVITAIDAQHNRLVVGKDEHLYQNHLLIREWHTSNADILLNDNNIHVKIRGIGRNPEGYATVHREGENLHVILNSPAWAPAKGQPVVFYRDEMVLGGGFLENYW